MSIPVTRTARRGFLGSVAAGAAALVVGRWSLADAEDAPPIESSALGDKWIARIKGKHKQVFDCTSPNAGFGIAFGLNFIDTTKQALKLTDNDVVSVVSYRHMSMPLMLNDAMWAKYKIGEVLDVKDPKTTVPATRNIFRDSVMGRPGMTYEQIAGRQNVILTACNVALTVLSGMAAPNAGVSSEEAKNDWTANLIPGVNLVPSGVYAVNRAQMAGCTYCNGG